MSVKVGVPRCSAEIEIRVPRELSIPVSIPEMLGIQCERIEGHLGQHFASGTGNFNPRIDDTECHDGIWTIVFTQDKHGEREKT